MRFCLALFLVFLTLAPARADVVDTAFSRAVDQFETALPQLPAELFGVDVSAYRYALTVRQFSSSYWGGTISLRVESGSKENASCARFAAFVRLPPSNGHVSLILCPQFRTEGADALRRLTVLHELVHVVAGPDECRAMAFAAQIEQLAGGRVTNVDRYWQANECDSSGFGLP